MGEVSGGVVGSVVARGEVENGKGG